MTQLKVKITKEILSQSRNCGKEGVGRNCAVALAICTVFPDAWVYSTYILPSSYTLPETRRLASNWPFECNIKLPKEASLFIIKFDNAQPEERLLLPELEFTIDIPDAVLEHIDISELMPLLENHPTLELIHA